MVNAILDKGNKIIEDCEEDKRSRTFFLKDFIEVLAFYYIKGVDSLRSLVTELEYNKLGIKTVPYSTMEDGFGRFKHTTFAEIFFEVLKHLNIIPVPELEMLGQICLVDGSIFKLSIRADWAEYRSNKRGIKLHLAWNLNKMIVSDLNITSAKFSEIEMLKKFIRAGITYVCDRGYVSFDLFNYIVNQGSHFVIRIKKNACYKVIKENTVNVQAFKNLKDSVIVFDNDVNQKEYRLVSFEVCGTVFNLLTDRLDLSTQDIILLYACRWQIELVFRFLKRTLNAIHLINESENGLYIQFYMLALVELLFLLLKQECNFIAGKKIIKMDLFALMNSPVSSVGSRLKQFWKIGKHWLIRLRGNLHNVFNTKIAKELAM